MSIELLHAGVKVTVLDGPYLVDGSPTPAAVAYYSKLVERLDEIREFAAAALLDLYNATWQVDEIGPLDRPAFAQRLTDPSVHVYDEVGAATVYFGDSDMFAGHWIEVRVDCGVPISADLAG